jgi:hypothetical protein
LYDVFTSSCAHFAIMPSSSPNCFYLSNLLPVTAFLPSFMYDIPLLLDSKQYFFISHTIGPNYLLQPFPSSYMLGLIFVSMQRKNFSITTRSVSYDCIQTRVTAYLDQ